MSERKQSLAGIVRESLLSIEEKIENGFGYESILDDLNNDRKLTISLSHFRTLLHRARKRKKLKSSNTLARSSSTSSECLPPQHRSSNEALSPSNPIKRHKDTETKTTRQNLNEIIKSKPDLTSYAEIAKGNK